MREANAAEIDAVVAATGARPIVKISARDDWWRAQPTGNRYESKNVLGRRCLEVCRQLRDDDQAAHSTAWADRIRVSCLAWRNVVPATDP